MGRYAEYAKRAVADWPPLTPEQEVVVRTALAAEADPAARKQTRRTAVTEVEEAA